MAPGAGTVDAMRKDLTYRLLLLAVSGLLLATTTRRYHGLGRIPAHGGALVVSNHISLADPPLLAHAVSRSGRLPRAMATAGLFRAPVLGALLRGMGHIPVARGTARAGESLAPAVDALQAGELVMLYPEGGISAGDQWPTTGKTGAARLALTAGVPVVPVAQWGIQRVLPPWTRAAYLRPLLAVLHRPRVHVSVGDPVTLVGDPNDPADVVAATATLMAAIGRQLETLRGPRPFSEPGPGRD